MSAILIRCRRTSRVVSTGLTTENVKFVSLAGIQFSMVCPFVGEYIAGSSVTPGSKVATKPKDSKIGEAKQEKSCDVLEKLNSGPAQR